MDTFRKMNTWYLSIFIWGSKYTRDCKLGEFNQVLSEISFDFFYLPI